jgi:oxalate decarboxylase/phosphoglucose isomerase-like protein (cupin superfamily)
MLEEFFHTKGNRHVNGEFEVYRVVMGQIAFVQTSPQLKEPTVTIAREGDMFNVTPYYFHRAVNITRNQPLVTSDLRPLNTETSYSPVEEEGFPINIVRDEKQNLFLWRKDSDPVALTDDLPEVQHPMFHSQIKVGAP